MTVKTRKRASRVALHAVMIVLSIAFLLPFFWMLSTALKSKEQLYLMPPVWIPRPMMWSNFKQASEFVPLFSYMGNTLMVAALDVLGTIMVCPLVAYGLSRLQWKGRDTLFLITLAVMMIPTEVTMVPSFILFSSLGLVGTYAPLFIQSFFGRPFMIFLMRQFFLGLPGELEDAARIDGASEFRIFRQVMLPLVVPGILTIGLFRFMNTWNDFTGPLLYLNKSSMYTISIGLQMFTTQYETEWSLLMAASIITISPVVFTYFLVQKRFIEGITFSGIKG